MIDAARLAANQIFTPPFRTVLFKSIGITIAVLVAAWFGLESLFDAQVQFENPLLDTASSVLAGLGLFAGAVFLIVPVTALVAGLFLDDIAKVVEETNYPHEAPGTPLPVGEAIWTAVKFAFVVIGANLLALFLLLIPGVNLVIFMVVNGYLLGREYFELAALRLRPVHEVKALRRQYKFKIFLGGLIIAGLLAVPIVNLLTPLFATAMMVHMHKMLTGSQPARVTPAPQAST